MSEQTSEVEESISDIMDFSDPGELDEEVSSGAPAEETSEEPVEEEETFKTPEDVLAEAQGKEAVPKGEPADVKESSELPAEAAPAALPEPVEEPKAPVAPQAAAEAEPSPAAEKPFDRDAARSHILEKIGNQYSFTEEEVDLLATAPEKVLPGMFAKVYVDVYEALYYSFANVMPQAVRSVVQQDTGVRDRENTFYSAHPELKDHVASHPQSAKQVAAAAAFWRSQNPEATPEQAIEGIGLMAKTMLGITSVPVEPGAPALPKPQLPRVPAAAKAGPGTGTPIGDAESKDITAIFEWEEPDE